MLKIGQKFPNPSVLTTAGLFQLHKYFDFPNFWGILFSHPKNFTPVCTTELSRLAKLQTEFDKRETKIICLSLDSIDSHNLWKTDIEEYSGCKVNYPLIADVDGGVSEELGMLDQSRKEKDAVQAVRAVYIIGRDAKIKTGKLKHYLDFLNSDDNCQIISYFKN